jgi:hypothetical protein
MVLNKQLKKAKVNREVHKRQVALRLLPGRIRSPVINQLHLTPVKRMRPIQVKREPDNSRI